MQYSAYRNDDSLEYLYLNSGKSADVFFHKLSKMPEYDQFGLLALIIMCMSPDTVCVCVYEHAHLIHVHVHYICTVCTCKLYIYAAVQFRKAIPMKVGI